LAYEIERQTKVLAAGERVIQETRHWDEQAEVTRGMRSKEEAHDYRYFPDPNLLPLLVDQGWVERIRATLPELPDARKRRFMEELGLSDYDAEVLVAAKDVADYYEEVLKYYGDAKMAVNWVMVELMGLLRKEGLEITACPVSAENLGKLLVLQEKGTISGKMAKDIFAEMFSTGQDPETIVKEKGLSQISDAGVLAGLVDKVLAANPESVAAYRGGKDRALGYLVGQVMKETRGQANPQLVNQLLRERLDQPE
ncbi:MAG: Asp-tRNA(Asn)/Glu-tRNA(Gln) amidotransferase GatCAB subunit B, partial [Bacillota bacterium]|nr:Asp-tRNA(Asn)/Glu-tRNA(Gln) amidotransferase GatCAB subunit B [Bacillota bacterium]